MGLDVTLYRYENFDASQANEDDAEKESEAIWARVGGGAKYDAMTDTQREEARTAVAEYNAAHGLSKWGSDERFKTKIEIDSAKYPEHMFKIGYFRSSYNAGGINRVVADLGGSGLYEIFNPGDEYHVRPDWTLAREAAVESLRKLNAAPKLRVMTIDAVRLFDKGNRSVDAAQAISLVQEERGRKSPFGEVWYSNASGDFTTGVPLKIVAAIPGTGILNTPCVHLVYEADDELAWYVQALEIVVETIDYVLAQPESERAKYVLHWSS